MSVKTPAIPQSAHSQLEALGAQLRLRRKALGVSATAAAEAAGLSRVTWYRIEKGRPSVSAGAYASAADALGSVWTCVEPETLATKTPDLAVGWLPLEIRIADYPQLRQLAWQMPGTAVLTPRQALSIYERNTRHVDERALDPPERALLKALRALYRGGDGV
ncbi:MAG: helix-turn-helix domain-containing protein [Xanthomonadales bacterium]|nr:helix-turn-helix domain-containing protein [Xanthomonadales bacterium]